MNKFDSLVINENTKLNVADLKGCESRGQHLQYSAKITLSFAIAQQKTLFQLFQ